MNTSVTFFHSTVGRLAVARRWINRSVVKKYTSADENWHLVVVHAINNTHNLYGAAGEKPVNLLDLCPQTFAYMIDPFSTRSPSPGMKFHHVCEIRKFAIKQTPSKTKSNYECCSGSIPGSNSGIVAIEMFAWACFFCESRKHAYLWRHGPSPFVDSAFVARVAYHGDALSCMNCFL